MELVIPDGKIVDRKRVIRFLDDPAVVFAGRCQAAGFDFTVASLDMEDAPSIDIRVVIDGKARSCTVRLLEVGGQALVIEVWCEPDRTAYLIVRRAAPDEPWRISTKALVLPTDAPESWGDAEEAIQQRAGRVLMFVAFVDLERWYAPLE